ncbi:MAG: efflux RND transporter periplasmic adaptor subunit [Longimicrobiales bacterium]
MTRRKKVIVAAAGAAVILLAGALYAVSRGDGSASDAPAGSDRMAGMRDMPGMDMGGMAMDGSIRLSARELSTFGVTFGTAEVRPLVRTIRTVGAVEFDETRMAFVAPKFGGWVERLYVDFTGKPVRKGQPLLDVYSPELVSAQEELILAVRMAESVGRSRVEGVASGAEELLESARRRLRYWDISDGQVRRIVETGEVTKTLTIYAPVSGIVMQKEVFAGQAFRPGQNLYMIADLSEVWINAEVFETDAALLREGMPAEISIAALPGRTLTGHVQYVYPTLQEKTRSMRARIALPNPGGTIKPGMYATVTFSADVGPTLIVPAAAVLYSGERAVVFVDMGGGSLMPHEITPGLRGQEYVQVIEGLEPGQRVVTSAQFLLDSESNLAEVMKAMMSQMNMSDMGAMEGMEGMDMSGSGGSMPGMQMPPVKKEN